jgi:hypothetical protein
MKVIRAVRATVLAMAGKSRLEQSYNNTGLGGEFTRSPGEDHGERPVRSGYQESVSFNADAME